MNQVVGIIPARYASSRFPGKPLAMLAGKPLVQHVWEKATRAKRLDTVIVATDDIRIAQAAFEFGAEVALTSQDHPTGTDRLTEVARSMKSATHFINIQGDEPLIDPDLIDTMVKAVVKKSSPPIVTAASPIHDPKDLRNPNVVKVVIDVHGRALYFSRAPLPWDRDGMGGSASALRHHGIYAYTRKALLRFVKLPQGELEKIEQLEQLRALEHGLSIGVVLAKHESIGVDTPEDLARMEHLLG